MAGVRKEVLYFLTITLPWKHPFSSPRFYLAATLTPNIFFVSPLSTALNWPTSWTTRPNTSVTVSPSVNDLIGAAYERVAQDFLRHQVKRRARRFTSTEYTVWTNCMDS